MHEQTVAPKRDLPDFPVTLVRVDGMTTVVTEAGLYVQLMQTGRFSLQEAPPEAVEPEQAPEPENEPDVAPEPAPAPAPAVKKKTAKKATKKKATKKKATKKKAKS